MIDRFQYYENVRAVEAAIARSPVDAALSGIMALSQDDLLILQRRLADIAAKTTADRVTLLIEKYEPVAQ